MTQPRIAQTRRGRLLYTALIVAGMSLAVVGVGLVFPPAALVLAGLAVGALGFLGLGIEVNR